MSYDGRKIESKPARARQPQPGALETLNATGDTAEDALTDWLEQQARAYGLRWLLAHADDGLIWGRVDADAANQTVQLKISSAVATAVSPPLRLRTLQSARLFSQEGELLLWRDGDNAFRSRLIGDVSNEDEADWIEAFDEKQMLWGTHGESYHDQAFTLLRDGAQGLRHAIPLTLAIESDGKTTPPRLVVRHYLNREGFARVVASRLVDFEEDPQ